jgi:glycosyltransferase involved in cell wall biosynthesis
LWNKHVRQEENLPLISIIIPTYRREHVLKRCVKSIFLQTYPFWELIIVNDGDLDETFHQLPGWIEEFKEDFHRDGPWRREKESIDHFSLNIFFVSFSDFKKRGVSASRNIGVSYAKGDWIAFCDSDDEWLPRKLELQWNEINVYGKEMNQPVRWCHGEEIWIRHGKRVNPMKKHQKKGGQIFEDCLDSCCVSPSAVLIEKNFFWEHGGFVEEFPVCEDYDLWLKMALCEPIAFVKNSIVVKYGGHDDQLSAKKFFVFDRWRLWSLVDLWLSYQKRRTISKHVNEYDDERNDQSDDEIMGKDENLGKIVKKIQEKIKILQIGRGKYSASSSVWTKKEEKIFHWLQDFFGIKYDEKCHEQNR